MVASLKSNPAKNLARPYPVRRAAAKPVEIPPMAEPIPAQKAPYGVDVQAGRTYFWCACGRSKKQPFCDGSHSGTGLQPLPYKATKDKKLWFCGCKATGSKPFCDGTHNKL
jgi:CDGSH-type Zn-finger protein